MKLLLISTLYLISGPVSCLDVIGYSGGSVIIYCTHKPYGVLGKYFCKEKTDQTPKPCINHNIQNKWADKERLSLYDSGEDFTVIYRKLSLQDAGSYQCGEAGAWSRDLKLTVNTDPCCSGSKTETGHLGETVTISCSYPEQYERHTKTFYRQDGHNVTPLIRTTETPRDRFSISDNTGSRVLSVRISGVREDDGGVYYCGVEGGGGSISYLSLYSEIQLRVTGNQSPPPNQPPPMGPNSATTPPTASTGTTAGEEQSSTVPGSSTTTTIIIPVCVCVVLLLIGGSALIFYRRRCRRTQESASSSDVATKGGSNRMSHSACEYEEIKDTNTVAGATPPAVGPPSGSPQTVYAEVELPSNPPVQDSKPTPEAHTYETVSFQKEDSLTDGTVAFNTEKSATVYSTVNLNTPVE